VVSQAVNRLVLVLTYAWPSRRPQTILFTLDVSECTTRLGHEGIHRQHKDSSDAGKSLGHSDRWAGLRTLESRIIRVDGKIALGEKIKAHVRLSDHVVRPVSVRVTTLEPPHRMVWTGGLPLGLFTGLRIFSIKSCDDGSVEFTMHVQLSGLLSSLIAKSLGDRQPDIEALAAGLKKWADRP